MAENGSGQFFDLHTHVLFGTDDGASDRNESLDLIRKDEAEGASAILMTPHYYADEPTRPAELKLKAEELKNLIAEKTGSSLPLLLGNEVLYFDGILSALRDGNILTLAGTDRVLIEFYPAESYSAVLRAVRNVFSGGFIPVIAHAERFRALRENGLAEVRENGAEVQIGTDVFENGMFDPTLKWCKKMLLSGSVTYLGTDMHRSKTRPPKAGKCVSWCLKNLPVKQAEQVLFLNAETNFMP